MRCLCSGQFLYCEHRMRIRKYTLLIPFNLNPRRITNNQIKSATLCKQVREFKLPMHKLVLFRNFAHQSKSRKQHAKVVDIHLALSGEQFTDLGNDFFLFGREQAYLLVFQHVGIALGGESSHKDQIQVIDEHASARQQFHLIDGPEPQGAPIVHGKFQSCIWTGILHMFGFIEF